MIADRKYKSVPIHDILLFVTKIAINLSWGLNWDRFPGPRDGENAMEACDDFITTEIYNSFPLAKEIAKTERSFSFEMKALSNENEMFNPYCLTRLHKHFKAANGLVPVWTKEVNKFNFIHYMIFL